MQTSRSTHATFALKNSIDAITYYVIRKVHISSTRRRKIFQLQIYLSRRRRKAPRTKKKIYTDTRSTRASYDPWESVVQKAFDKCAEQFEEEVTKQVHRDDISKPEARSRFYIDMRSKYRKAMITVFTNIMVWFDALRKHPVYKTIKKTATNLIDLDDYSSNEAWKSAIGQLIFLFDIILEEYYSPEMESKDDESESEVGQEDDSNYEAEKSTDVNGQCLPIN